MGFFGEVCFTRECIKQIIFKSVSNINLNTVISYKKDKKIYNFKDEYNKKTD